MESRHPGTCTEFDAIQCIIYSTIVLLQEDTQISGIIIIVDFANVQLKHLYSISSVIELIKQLSYITNMRTPGVYILNLPTIAQFLDDVSIRFASKKVKKRITVLK